MKSIRSIGWTVFAVLTILSPKIAHPECKMAPNSKLSCSCTKVDNCDCLCNCSVGKTLIGEPKKNQLREQELMLIEHIQAKEGVDKSKIINLDEVIQKAVEESSQKVDTPVKFMVKIQEKENAPPKEVEYQIEMSQ